MSDAEALPMVYAPPSRLSLAVKYCRRMASVFFALFLLLSVLREVRA